MSWPSDQAAGGQTKSPVSATAGAQRSGMPNAQMLNASASAISHAQIADATGHENPARGSASTSALGGWVEWNVNGQSSPTPLNAGPSSGYRLSLWVSARAPT